MSVTISLSLKDLGIFICNDLKFSYHINYISRSALLCAYQILCFFSTKNVWILLEAFMCYVRPKLEYSRILVYGILISKKTCHILNRFKKNLLVIFAFVVTFHLLPIFDYLHILGIKSLEYRGIEFDLILMYKICYYLSDLRFDDYFVFRDTGYNLRQHSLSVQTLQQCKHIKYQHFFFNRIVNIWNLLLNDVVIPPSLSSLKHRLKNFDLHAITSILV